MLHGGWPRPNGSVLTSFEHAMPNISKITDTMPKSWPTSVFLAVFASLALSHFSNIPLLSAVTAAAVAAATTFLGFYLLGRHDARLLDRMKADGPDSWYVIVNGVGVGSVSDAQYAAFQRHAFGSGACLLEQVSILAIAVMRMAGRLAVAIPLMAFWLAVAFLYAAPEVIQEFANAWHANGSKALADAWAVFMPLTILLLSVYALALLAFFPHRLGVRNAYTDAVARLIRQQCGNAADGEMVLAKVKGRGPDVASLEQLSTPTHGSTP